MTGAGGNDRRMKKERKESIAIAAICVLLGFLMTLQLKSITQENVKNQAETSRVETLQGLLNEERNNTEKLEESVEALNKELDLYRSKAADSGSYGTALAAELEKAELLAGLTDVSGPGVEVVMKDSASKNTTGDESDYLIHDSDVLSVINELRDAGAEALSINGERILATTEIRCSGSTVSVNNNRYSAPFVIVAIGEKETLYNALMMRNGVVSILKQWSISVSVTMYDDLFVGGFKNTLDYKYAQPVKEGGTR